MLDIKISLYRREEYEDCNKNNHEEKRFERDKAK